MQTIFKKVMFALLGIVFLFLTAGSIHHISVCARMTAEYTHNQQYWTILGIVVLLVCIGAFSDFVAKKEKYRKWTVRVLWLILHLGEIFWLGIFSCYPTSDSAEVVHGSIQLANGNSRYLEYAEYFQKYGNNNLLTIATAKIYQVSRFFCSGNMDYIRLNHIINMLLLNLSVYLGYSMIKKYKGEEYACKMLFLSVINPVMYMAVFWYYSATVSIFFSMCILYLAVEKQENMQKKIRYWMHKLFYLRVWDTDSFWYLFSKPVPDLSGYSLDFYGIGR